MISDYDNPTSSPIQFSPSFAEDGTVFAYAGPDVLRSTDGGATWDVLTLPTIEEVADSLGVEVDALSHDGHQADEPGSGRRTYDTPFGVLSDRRLAAAALAGGAAALATALLAPRWSSDPIRRWGLSLVAFAVVFVVAAVVLAA